MSCKRLNGVSVSCFCSVWLQRRRSDRTFTSTYKFSTHNTAMTSWVLSTWELWEAPDHTKCQFLPNIYIQLLSKATYNKYICHKGEVASYRWSEKEIQKQLSRCIAAVIEVLTIRTYECRVGRKSRWSLNNWVFRLSAEDGERLCCPDISREFVPLLRCQNRFCHFNIHVNKELV